jgi:hypothetical protein
MKRTIYESSLLAAPDSVIVDRRREYAQRAADIIPQHDPEAYELHMRDLALRRLAGEGYQLSIWRPRPVKVEERTDNVIFWEVCRGHK